VPLHHPTLEVSISAHYASQTETPPGKGKSFNKDVEEKTGFLRAWLSLLGFIAKVASPLSTRRDYRDS
jgi:hypothetical protein